jgi:hypothetical protein
MHWNLTWNRREFDWEMTAIQIAGNVRLLEFGTRIRTRMEVLRAVYVPDGDLARTPHGGLAPAEGGHSEVCTGIDAPVVY